MNDTDISRNVRVDELDERSTSRSQETSTRDPALPKAPMISSGASHNANTAPPIFNAFNLFAFSPDKYKSPRKPGDEVHDVFMGVQTHIETLPVNNDDINPLAPAQLLDDNLMSNCMLALKCIENNDFGRLMKIVKNNPKILEIIIPKGNSKLQGLNGGTLLHVLVSQRLKLKKSKTRTSPQGPNVIHAFPSVPDSVVKAVIKMYPRALEMEDNDGRLPLHCACLSLSKHLEEAFSLCSNHPWLLSSNVKHQKVHFHSHQTNIALLVLRFNKRCAKVADKDGNLPVHYVAAMCPDYFYDESSPESHTKTHNHLHHLKQLSARDTMNKLLDVYPNSIITANNKGMYPINVVASMGNKMNKSCLELLLMQHQSLGEPPNYIDKNGDAPLYAAIKSGASHDIIRLFAETNYGKSSHLFVQRDSDNNNALHVALQPKYPNIKLIRTILDIAPFTASSPDSQGVMPIKRAVQLRLDEDVICNMLSRDLPIEIGRDKNKAISSSKFRSPFNGVRKCSNVVGRCHHHSWWFILVSGRDYYLNMVYNFLSKEATHFQIISLARQVGPDGKSVLIDCVSEKCRAMFQTLLRFYDRYEVLLSSNELRAYSDEVVGGMQTFVAFDHGFMPPVSGLKFVNPAGNVATHIKDVKVEGENQDNSEIEVSLLHGNVAKVLLRVYSFEQAFHAEIKLREMYTFDPSLFEEVYNYHRHEHYSNLPLSKADKIYCIAFERPEHNLSDVFGGVLRGPKTKKWNKKSCLVLKQLANALKALHDQYLIHGHLEPKNICKYGNQWKISQLGTVTLIGTPMRGTFRSSSPPESIFVSRSNGTILNNEDVKLGKKSSRVKFSPQVLVSGKVKKMNGGRENFWRQESEAYHCCFTKVCPTWDATKDSTPQEVSSFVSEDVNIAFSPERVQASVAWDMWGFGLIMTQLLLGNCMHLTTFEKAEDAIMKKLYCYDDIVLQRICNQLEKTVGKQASDLVNLLLQKDPTKRPPSMEDVLVHPYFQVLTVDI
mmetsp:Transcript_1125/g.2036  ORF Transcript_1125/g.2036 Transcript_1125/m.2036 type:complete len:1002 (-) Transcript_1125:6842-9847(-)